MHNYTSFLPVPVLKYSEVLLKGTCKRESLVIGRTHIIGITFLIVDLIFVELQLSGYI
jgi:hypothetical protein